MASLANLENQQINGVLGIWYNGEFGKFWKINKSTGIFGTLSKNFENGEFGKSTDQRSFRYMV